MLKKMVSWLIPAALLISSLILSGCRPAGGLSAGETAAPLGNGASAQSLSIRLALGTLYLEGTDLAVTPEQASELLPLWKAAKNLGGSDNLTTDEYNAIFEQIQETLTSAQMEEIRALDLSGPVLVDLGQKFWLPPSED